MMLPLWLLVAFVCSSPKDHRKRIRCHDNDGPSDLKLRCDSSAHQIVSVSDGHAQKQNLIIFDIDLTILEAMRGFHAAIPLKVRENTARVSLCIFCKKSLGLDLMFIQQPEYSIVFREHFFQILEYMHSHSTDLVLYTRARPEYAQQVAVGITACFKKVYSNLTDPLFKMIVSSTTSQTAKTISTLSHNLNVSQYENIIILDDYRGGWFPPLTVWNNVYREFEAMNESNSVAVSKPRDATKFFYALIAKHRNQDKMFVRFQEFLVLLLQHKVNRLWHFAIPSKESNYSETGQIVWWEWVFTK